MFIISNMNLRRIWFIIIILIIFICFGIIAVFYRIPKKEKLTIKTPLNSDSISDFLTEQNLKKGLFESLGVIISKGNNAITVDLKTPIKKRVTVIIKSELTEIYEKGELKTGKSTLINKSSFERLIIGNKVKLLTKSKIDKDTKIVYPKKIIEIIEL